MCACVCACVHPHRVKDLSLVVSDHYIEVSPFFTAIATCLEAPLTSLRITHTVHVSIGRSHTHIRASSHPTCTLTGAYTYASATCKGAQYDAVPHDRALPLHILAVHCHSKLVCVCVCVCVCVRVCVYVTNPHTHADSCMLPVCQCVRARRPGTKKSSVYVSVCVSRR